MITNQTKQYWLNVFDAWAEARLPGPQYDEAHQVLVECGLGDKPTPKIIVVRREHLDQLDALAEAEAQS